MPVTQRWVHGGLLLVAGILSLSLTVLILGASRTTVSDSGLVGSSAPIFSLKDSADAWVNLKDCRDKVVVLIISPAESTSFEKQGKQIQQLVESFSTSKDVRFLGIEFDPRSGLLGPARSGPGAIQSALPTVQTLHDVDSSVALAYRVGYAPVMFVIDTAGVIRARLKLDSEGATVAASESIMSLRQTEFTMPTSPTDRKVD